MHQRIEIYVLCDVQTGKFVLLRSIPRQSNGAEKIASAYLKNLLFLARPTRFERATPAFGGRYSIQLSYGRVDEQTINAVYRPTG